MAIILSCFLCHVVISLIDTHSPSLRYIFNQPDRLNSAKNDSCILPKQEQAVFGSTYKKKKKKKTNKHRLFLAKSKAQLNSFILIENNLKFVR